jgi:hypothetical protein
MPDQSDHDSAEGIAQLRAAVDRLRALSGTVVASKQTGSSPVTKTERLPARDRDPVAC